ncbi:hypothetical protein BGW80DRAFT_1204854, partial [Lactifluus volemus]
CSDCDIDLREENDVFFGGFGPPSALRLCLCLSRSHSGWNRVECSQCYGWKKQITRARAAAKKAGRT